MRFMWFAVGGLAVALSVLGFLMAGVALNHVNDAGVSGPTGDQLQLSPDSPKVQRRQQQAERVLFGSLVTGVLGVSLLGIGFRRRSTLIAAGGSRRVQEPHREAEC